MAFSYTIADRISFGNTKLAFVNLTNVQNDGTSIIKIGDTALAVKAVNNTDPSDTFKEKVGPDSAVSTRNAVTFTSVSNNDDGLAAIWYR